MARQRLDVELVRRGLVRSRETAREAIDAGRVRVRGMVAAKAATMVDSADAIVLDPATRNDDFASRGAHKLVGALESFAGLQVSGRVCLDAGASTGGFTDVLLRRGAARIFAVDVGYGQLEWRLREDPRVVVMDRTNVRHLTRDDLEAVPSLIVADLSFISLTVVLPALMECVDPRGDLLVMVKPQFEVGRGALGAKGVVRDPQQRVDAVLGVARFAYDRGWGTAGIVASPLPGPAGNVEYFCWLRAGAPAPLREDVQAAVEAGP